MSTRTWLGSLAAGDEVILVGSDGDRAVVKVARLTKTQIILTTGTAKFWRENGRQVGADAWRWMHLEQATSEAVAAVRAARERETLLAKVRKISWAQIGTDALRQVLALVGSDIARQKADSEARVQAMKDRAGQA